MDTNTKNMIIKEAMEIDARVELFTRQLASIMRFACVLGEEGASLLNFVKLTDAENTIIPRDSLLPMMRSLRPITRMHYANYLVEMGFLDELPDTYVVTEAMQRFRMILFSPLMEDVIPQADEASVEQLSDIDESGSAADAVSDFSSKDSEIDAEIDRLFFGK